MESSDNDNITSTSYSSSLLPNHTAFMKACATGDHTTLKSLLNSTPDPTTRRLLSAQQDTTSGKSPLILAATHGHFDICETLLQEGAPWNALDRFGKCAGNYATEGECWEVVNLLVEYATRAELILGASIRLGMKEDLDRQKVVTTEMEDTINNPDQMSKCQKTDDDASSNGKTTEDDDADTSNVPVSHQPCTKPDYLTQSNVRYNAANTLLLDNDDDAVMMEWERPLMEAHASFLAGNALNASSNSNEEGGSDVKGGKRVLNIGFGLGIIDTAMQSYNPSLHVIIEAHPTVYNKMIVDGWDKKKNVRICFGRWQDELPKLLEEGVMFDGIFYDTYGEHFTDLEDFHGE